MFAPDRTELPSPTRHFRSPGWPRLNEAARLRIENKLIASIKAGKWTQRLERCTAGALGTWIQNIAHLLILKDEHWQVAFWKLERSDKLEQDYIFKYLMDTADKCFSVPPFQLVNCVNAGIEAGDKRFNRLARRWKYDSDFEERKQEDPWRQLFAESVLKYTEVPETANQQGDFGGGDPIPF